MHICIPDTREVKPQHGSAYLLYNVHIDGLYHCSLRYKQLHHLHTALCKRFPSGNSDGVTMPAFPPKKLFSLTPSQVEDRRQLLEKYLQNISQVKQISNSSLFNVYLLEAQRESSTAQSACSTESDASKHVVMDIELVNGQKIRLPIVTRDSLNSVLTACCRALGLADQYHAYFCLCLSDYDVVKDRLIIKRRLSSFEAPYLTLQTAIQQQEQLQSVLQSSVLTNYCNHQNQHHNHNHNHHHHHYQDHYQASLSSLSSTSSTNLTTSNNFKYFSSSCGCTSCSIRAAAAASGCKQVKRVPTDGFSLAPVQQHAQYTPRCCCCSSSGSANQLQPTTSAPRLASRPPNSRGSSAFVTHHIVLRKSYWDPIYDSYILGDQQALNLLFIQTVYDVKHSLTFVDRATYAQLESLLASDAKLEYILLARTLPYYNYVHFEPCYSDYPRPRTKVMISIGTKELNMRVLKSPTGAQRGPATTSQQQQQQQSFPASSSLDHQRQQVLYCSSSLVPRIRGQERFVTKDELIEEEYNFKVPLIRCWRLTSIETLNPSDPSLASSHDHQHRQAPAAVKTLAGGKRNNLSLFNSVVGSVAYGPSGAHQPGERHSFHRNGHGDQQPTSQLNGIGGSSLMATLIAHTGDNNNNNLDDNNTIIVAHPQASSATATATTTTNNFSNNNATRATTATTNGTSNSFFPFSSNTNQTATATSLSAAAAAATTTTSSNTNNRLQSNCDEEMTTGGEPPVDDHTQLSHYELSFEYLIAKDTLRWITISSDQAIFISISLQQVVDELVSNRDIQRAPSLMTSSDMTRRHSQVPTNHASRPIAIQQQDERSCSPRQPRPPVVESFTYLYQDGSQRCIKARSKPQLIDRLCNTGTGSSTLSVPLTSGPCSSGDFVLASTSPSSSTSSSASSTPSSAAAATSTRRRLKSERCGTSANGISPFSSPPRRQSILPSLSPPSRYYGHQSSSGANYGAASGQGASSVAPLELAAERYYCNTRHNGKLCKAPSPIINDAFEGLVDDQ